MPDKAISESGYSGFRTDPFRGYGGMMEEGIPVNELKSVKKDYISRVTGRPLYSDR